MKEKIIALCALFASVIVVIVSFYYLMFRSANGLPCGLVAAQLFAAALIMMICVGNTYHLFKPEPDDDDDL